MVFVLILCVLPSRINTAYIVCYPMIGLMYNLSVFKRSFSVVLSFYFFLHLSVEVSSLLCLSVICNLHVRGINSSFMFSIDTQTFFRSLSYYHL